MPPQWPMLDVPVLVKPIRTEIAVTFLTAGWNAGPPESPWHDPGPYSQIGNFLNRFVYSAISYQNKETERAPFIIIHSKKPSPKKIIKQFHQNLSVSNFNIKSIYTTLKHFNDRRAKIF